MTAPVSPETSISSFQAFSLAEPILRGLSASGFQTPTEIQAKALPLALAGRDLMASAQTGTGKTAAFVLPALQRLLQPARGKGRGPRVLILTPTRELAAQVEAVVRQLGRHTRLSFGAIVGGVSMGPQHRLLRAPLDVLVATPGRLMDHMGQGGLDFSRLELFVLDEADRMLDMGFIRPVRKIASALPADRQTLLFSATLEGEVGEVAKSLMRDPARIQLASVRVKHESIAQHLHVARDSEHKHALLAHLLADPAMERAIVFTATKRGADRLAKRLNTAGFSTAALHGNMKQNARTRTVDLLRRGKVNILVATDVAARGIDLIGVSHVINFNLPMVAEDYIHRIGRTGRNGATGTAISLVDPDDRTKLGMIERLTGRRLERQEAAGFVFTRPERPAGSPIPASDSPPAPRRFAPRNDQTCRRPSPRPDQNGRRPGGRVDTRAKPEYRAPGYSARNDESRARSEYRAPSYSAPLNRERPDNLEALDKAVNGNVREEARASAPRVALGNPAASQHRHGTGNGSGRGNVIRGEGNGNSRPEHNGNARNGQGGASGRPSFERAPGNRGSASRGAPERGNEGASRGPRSRTSRSA